MSGDTVTVTLVCHCGERFTIDEIYAAQEHVHSHEVEEPTS